MEILGISLYNFILWAVFGIMVGCIAANRDHSDVSGGIVVTAIFGGLGAVASGYLTSFLLGKAMITFSLEGLLLAGAGALFIALFYRFSFRNEGFMKTKQTDGGK